MNPESSNEFHELEDKERTLYNPKTAPTESAPHTFSDVTAKTLPTAWVDETTEHILAPTTVEVPGISFGMKLFFVACAVLVLALSFTAWRVMSSRNVVSSENIDVVLDSKPYVEGGEATPFTVSVLNRNTVPLQDAVLTLSYEKGVGVQDEQAKVYDKRVLGVLPPNALHKEDMTVTVYGQEADNRTITVKLEYKVAGANAVFNKIVTTSVVLKTPPIAVHIDGPTSLVAGQVATFAVTLTNNTSTTTAPSLLALSLPQAFTVQKTTPSPATKGYVYDVDALSPGQTATFQVTGFFAGQGGETNTLKASVGSRSGSLHEIGVVYAEEHQTVALTQALLGLILRLDTDRGGVDSLRYGDKVSLTVSYENKSGQALKNPALVVHLSGDAPILSSVTSDNGYYDSLSKTITFDSSTDDSLAALSAGEKGSFVIHFPIVSRGTNAPALTVTVDGKATLSTADDTMTKITKTWSVEGSASVSAVTLFDDALFPNTGPLPPEANKETTYAARITTSAQNSLSSVKVSFLLPGYVSWTGVYGEGSNVTYDLKTRRVTWNIGTLAAAHTLSNDFKLSVKPSQSHVGQMPAITSGITLEADETDSRAHIRMTTNALTTELRQDSGAVDLSHVVGGQ